MTPSDPNLAQVAQILIGMDTANPRDIERRIHTLPYASLRSGHQEDVQELLLPILDSFLAIDRRYSPFQITHEYARSDNPSSIIVKEQTTHLLLNIDSFGLGLEEALNQECEWKQVMGNMQISRSNISMTPALIIILVPYDSVGRKVPYTGDIPELLMVRFGVEQFPFRFQGSIFHRGPNIDQGHYFNILRSEISQYVYVSDETIHLFGPGFKVSEWQTLQGNRWDGLTPVVLFYSGLGF